MRRIVPMLVAISLALGCADEDSASSARPASRDQVQPMGARLAAAPPSPCGIPSLTSQCVLGCKVARPCASGAISHYALLCGNGEITPDLAAQRVSLACDSCIDQHCR